MLRLAAMGAADQGRFEIAMYLCRDCDVPTSVRRDDEPQTIDSSTNLTPLSIAIEKGHEDLALQVLAIPQPRGMEAKNQLVMSAGATTGNLNFLHWAAGWDAPRVVEALVVEHGMDINVKDTSKYTALDHAVHSYNVAIARFLLEKQRESRGLEQALKREWVDLQGDHCPSLLHLISTNPVNTITTAAELERFEERQ